MQIRVIHPPGLGLGTVLGTEREQLKGCLGEVSEEEADALLAFTMLKSDRGSNVVFPNKTFTPFVPKGK